MRSRSRRTSRRGFGSAARDLTNGPTDGRFAEAVTRPGLATSATCTLRTLTLEAAFELAGNAAEEYPALPALTPGEACRCLRCCLAR